MATSSTLKLSISSPSFRNNETLPVEFTCEGRDINPALTIGNIPEGTKCLAVIVEDPDAPHGTFDHWITWNIHPVEVI